MSKENYPHLRRWSDQFLPTVQKILGPYMLEPADERLDTKEATDLVIVQAKDKRIAVRVRGKAYTEKYGDEFTIRWHANVKGYSEYHKIISGYADWLFYGFEAQLGAPEIDRWHLIDLHAFRYHMSFNPDAVKWGIKGNGPNDPSQLAWFKIDSFPKDPFILITASYPF